MKLEQITYEPLQLKKVETRRSEQQFYATDDLEYLSGTAFYTGPIMPGDALGFSLPTSSRGGSAPIKGSAPLNLPSIGIPTLSIGESISEVSQTKSFFETRFAHLLPKPKLFPIDLKIEATGTSYKIFDPEKGGEPLTRLDLESHGHKMPEIHIQHGHKDHFGRNGNEAADIFAEIYRKNPSIKFPWEK